jgi:hypothetical protein
MRAVCIVGSPAWLSKSPYPAVITRKPRLALTSRAATSSCATIRRVRELFGVGDDGREGPGEIELVDERLTHRAGPLAVGRGPHRPDRVVLAQGPR